MVLHHARFPSFNLWSLDVCTDIVLLVGVSAGLTHWGPLEVRGLPEVDSLAIDLLAGVVAHFVVFSHMG